MAPVHRGDCIVVEKWVTNTGEKVTVCRDLSYRRRRLGAAGFHQRSYYKFVIRDSADRVSPRFRTASVRLRRVVYFLSLFFFSWARATSSTCVPNSSAKRSQPVYVPRCFEVRERTAISPTRNPLLSHPFPYASDFFSSYERFTCRSSKRKKKKKDGTLKRRETSLFSPFQDHDGRFHVYREYF